MSKYNNGCSAHLAECGGQERRPTPVILATGDRQTFASAPGRVLEAAAHPGLAQFGVNAIVQFVEPDEDGKSQGGSLGGRAESGRDAEERGPEAPVGEKRAWQND
ncbi:hypothetical protein PAPYR_10618 [Paratrimastix pyriformis]|uniref:Uncharacterized protein n=1 Tax=Paratrimastix pyriformis TaxID=342808 RepID=A0ABQ8U5I7_9EUKA|nr:hypothetical protein PAPYR_10618 [Paratrimastix pyriformis]